MKLLFLLFFNSFALLNQGTEIRILFNEAVNNEKKTEELLLILTRQNPQPSQVNYAYWGAAETLMGKHALNPMTKLSWLDKGLEKLNKSVQALPANPVPRYLRITVESQVPAFLGKSTHLKEDKKILLQQLQTLSNKKDCKTLNEIVTGVLSMKIYNNSESELLRKISNQCSTKP